MFNQLKATLERIEHENYREASNGLQLWAHDLATLKEQINMIEDAKDIFDEIHADLVAEVADLKKLAATSDDEDELLQAIKDLQPV